ncbi:MAG: hypothetical protein ACRDWI_09830 [Jiangellaceae bacterium]
MSTPPPDQGPRGLPSHPEADESFDAAGRDTGVNWATVVVFALIGALVVVILILHLTGVVGPAGHG